MKEWILRLLYQVTLFLCSSHDRIYNRMIALCIATLSRCNSNKSRGRLIIYNPENEKVEQKWKLGLVGRGFSRYYRVFHEVLIFRIQHQEPGEGGHFQTGSPQVEKPKSY